MRAELEVTRPDGQLRFTCFDNWLSRWRSAAILRGETYPHLSFIGEVRTVVDVGANCGATSTFFATHHPQATVHALEPAREPYELLLLNAEGRPGIVPHNVGLHREDRELPLYNSGLDSGTASVIPDGSSPGEVVTLRAAGDWLAEQGITRIDILKVDVEGCEMAVLESMAELLPSVKALYVEYGGLETRRELDRLLEPSHEMALGRIMLTHGEAVYIERSLAGEEAATEIGHLVAAQLRASATGQRPDQDSNLGPTP
jgi:FkbM family methyltransferase